MILDAFKLGGRAALVTGAGRGIGRACALALAEAGADVALAGRSEGVEETKREIEKLGRRALALRADLSKMEAIPKVVDAALEAFGRIDVLVNNSGIVRRARVLEYSEKDWDEVLQINLKTLFFLSQAVARDMMKRKKGRILNVSSLTYTWGGTNIVAYAASKAGVAQVTKAMCNELGPHGIQVNAIAPGYIATDINRDLRSIPEKNAELLSRIPMGRYGTPDDLKGLVVFLASDANTYMNGSVVVYDGGFLAR